MGFAANLMMKARSLKEGVTEKSQSGGFSLGNVQVGYHDECVEPCHGWCHWVLTCYL